MGIWEETAAVMQQERAATLPQGSPEAPAQPQPQTGIWEEQAALMQQERAVSGLGQGSVAAPPGEYWQDNTYINRADPTKQTVTELPDEAAAFDAHPAHNVIIMGNRNPVPASNISITGTGVAAAPKPDIWAQEAARNDFRKAMDSGADLIGPLKRLDELGVFAGEKARSSGGRRIMEDYVPPEPKAAFDPGTGSVALNRRQWEETRRQWQIENPNEPLPQELQVFQLGLQDQSVIDATRDNTNRPLLHDPQMMAEAANLWKQRHPDQVGVEYSKGFDEPGQPALTTPTRTIVKGEITPYVLHGTETQRIAAARAASVETLRNQIGEPARTMSDDNLLAFANEKADKEASRVITAVVRTQLGSTGTYADIDDATALKLYKRDPKLFQVALFKAMAPEMARDAMARAQRREMIGALPDDTPARIEMDQAAINIVRQNQASEFADKSFLGIPLGFLETWAAGATLGLIRYIPSAGAVSTEDVFQAYGRDHPYAAILASTLGFMTPYTPAAALGKVLNPMIAGPIEKGILGAVSKEAAGGMTAQVLAHAAGGAAQMPAYSAIAEGIGSGDWQSAANQLNPEKPQFWANVLAGGALSGAFKAVPLTWERFTGFRRIQSEGGKLRDILEAAAATPDEAAAVMRNAHAWDLWKQGVSFPEAMRRAGVRPEDPIIMRGVVGRAYEPGPPGTRRVPSQVVGEPAGQPAVEPAGGIQPAEPAAGMPGEFGPVTFEPPPGPDAGTIKRMEATPAGPPAEAPAEPAPFPLKEGQYTIEDATTAMRLGDTSVEAVLKQRAAEQQAAGEPRSARATEAGEIARIKAAILGPEPANLPAHPAELANSKAVGDWYDETFHDVPGAAAIETLASMNPGKFVLRDVPIDLIDPNNILQTDVRPKDVRAISKLNEIEARNLPPVIAVDNAGQLMIADGTHRLLGRKAAGDTTIKAYIPESVAASLPTPAQAKGEPHAIEKGKEPESGQLEHPGDDEGRPSTEPVSGGGAQPEAPKPAETPGARPVGPEPVPPGETFPLFHGTAAELQERDQVDRWTRDLVQAHFEGGGSIDEADARGEVKKMLATAKEMAADGDLHDESYFEEMQHILGQAFGDLADSEQLAGKILSHVAGPKKTPAAAQTTQQPWEPPDLARYVAQRAKMKGYVVGFHVLQKHPDYVGEDHYVLVGEDATQTAKVFQGGQRYLKTAADGTPYLAIPGEAWDSLVKYLVGKGKKVAVASSTEPPATPAKSTATATHRLAKSLLAKLESGTTLNWLKLVSMGNDAFGGTMAEGKYSATDLIDAMELGVNLLIHQQARAYDPAMNLEHAINAARNLEDLVNRLPTQTRRDKDKTQMQQFSTPPHYAFAANWIANIQPHEQYLEPTAGNGGLAVFGLNARATVTVNELDPARANNLASFPFDTIWTEDAAQLHNILPADYRPTIVVMNPPFSQTAGRMGDKRDIMVAANHIEQMLLQMPAEGARLVAIVGRGMSMESPTYKPWWDKIKGQYVVKANVLVSGDVYKKYGTHFETRVLVIDKMGMPTTQEPLGGEVKSVVELMQSMQEVRDARPQVAEVAPVAPKPLAPEPPGGIQVPGGGGRAGPPAPVHPAVPGVGAPTRTGGGPRPGGAPPAAVPGGPGPAVAPGGHAPPVGGATGPTGGAGVLPPQKPAPGGGEPAVRAGRGGEPPVEPAKPATPKAAITEAPFESYEPEKLAEGVQPHPSDLVESAAMATVGTPPITYEPKLDPAFYASGRISDAQLEAISLAGQAHDHVFADGTRQGFMLGDGTGVGKGVEISGIILDNWNRGRKKAIWVSKNFKLLEDAKRDWKWLDQDTELLMPQRKTKAGEAITADKGILFTGYATLSKNWDGDAKNRMMQIVNWAGRDFDGVLVFDEAHTAKNAIGVRGKRGTTEPSEMALAVIQLQALLPKARVVYSTATGATEVANLAYAPRLGLWGADTAFPNVIEFVNQIHSGGIAAMELVARDLKQSGLYMSRNLSYEGVQYRRITHELTGDQIADYDKLADAWALALDHFNAALALTAGITRPDGTVKIDGRAKNNAMSAFWGAQQRFFNQVLTSMQMPSVLKDIEKTLKEGHADANGKIVPASVVLQLVNTNEASQDRAIAAMEEDDDLADLDLTPRDQLMQLIKSSYPVKQYEEYTDETGNVRMRQVTSSNGEPVLNKEAVAKRDQLLAEIASIRVPDGPLEAVLNHFGVENVAEVTGRTQRVVRIKDRKTGGEETVLENRSEAKAMADAAEFQRGKKRILIFSDAGGTGASYDANAKVKNQELRVHYLVQAGWIADRAVQGFGRTHRSGEIQPPAYVLVSTDLKGQMRFISSIARRLDQLGALTKGQRAAASQGLFKQTDNLESRHAKDALFKFFKDLFDHKIPNLTVDDFEQATGLHLTSEGKQGPTLNLPGIPQFLNRLLAMRVGVQNATFGEFMDRFEAELKRAEAEGTLDLGVETFKADSIVKEKERVVKTAALTGAKTNLVTLAIKNRTDPRTYREMAGRTGVLFVRNRQSGLVWAATKGPNRTDVSTGGVYETYRLQSPAHQQIVKSSDFLNVAKWEPLEDVDARKLWAEAMAKVPEFTEDKMHLITGAILPIWDRLLGYTKVLRLQTDAGERFLGRAITEDDLAATLENLGLGAESKVWTAKEAQDAILFDDKVAHLANGWQLSRKGVSGEHRMLLTGPGYRDWDTLGQMGMIREEHNYKTSIYVPTGPAGQAILERLFASKPVVKMVTRKTNDLPDEALSADRGPVQRRAGEARGEGAPAESAEIIPEIIPDKNEPLAGVAEADEAMISEGVLPFDAKESALGYLAVKHVLKPIEMPELVKMARELLGKFPMIYKRLRTSLGAFRANSLGEKDILIHPGTAENEYQLAKTLAHEIGHLWDFLPDNTLARGNLLGRIHSLHTFMLNWWGTSTISNKAVRKELIALSEWWRGEIKGNARQIAYRRSAKELYADAISVLLNTPMELEERAPAFLGELLQYLNTKPDVLAAYMDVLDLLSGTPADVAAARRTDIREQFRKAEDIWKARAAERAARKVNIIHWINQVFIDSHAPIQGRETPGAADRPMTYAMQELQLADNANHLMLDRVQQYVVEPLVKAGLDIDALGEYLFLSRVMFERTDIANPLGFTPETAGRQLHNLRQMMTGEQEVAIQAAVNEFHEIVTDAAAEATTHGVYSQKNWTEVVLPNKANYATFGVLDYLSEHIPAAIIHQVGTFKEVANPFVTTVMKTMTLIRLTELNKAKNAVRDGIQKVTPKDFVKQKPRKGPGGRDLGPRPSPEGMETLTILEDGKPVHYDVDRYIARAFQLHDIGVLNALGQWFQSLTYGYFHPLFVTYNPAWQVFNYARDFQRTWMNLSGKRTGVTLRQLLKAYWGAKGAAWRRAHGVRDATIDEMLAARGLDVPFVNYDPTKDTLQQYERVLLRHGFGAPPKSRGILLRTAHGILDWIEMMGIFSETLPKVAAWNYLKGKGIDGRQRAFVVRNRVGTPNLRTRGLATNVTNAVWMYSKIQMAGLRADAAVSVDPSTRMGFWAKRFFTNVLPKLIMKAGMLGLFGLMVKKILDMVGDYDRRNYVVVPLGTRTDANGNEKAVVLRLPQDETGRLIGGIVDALLAQDGSGKAVTQIPSFLYSQGPSVAPPLQIMSNWAQFAAGRNPPDAFYRRNVVTDTAWKAGGWEANKEMTWWTLNQFGVVSIVAKGAIDMAVGPPPGESQETTTEMVVGMIPGLNRILKFTDKGVAEREWLDIEMEDQEKARLKLRLDSGTLSMIRERYRLDRLGPTKLSDREENRRGTLNHFYTNSYLKFTRAIAQAEKEHDSKEAEKLRRDLAGSAKVYRQAMGDRQ